MAQTTAEKGQLADRFIEFGGRVCAIIRKAPRDVVLENVFRQLGRCATSPAANYAEARESVSSREYVFKMKICVKELRESLAWLRIAHGAGFKRAELEPLMRECHELIAISVTCIRRALGSS
jgi:four helix bundle protein